MNGRGTARACRPPRGRGLTALLATALALGLIACSSSPEPPDAGARVSASLDAGPAAPRVAATLEGLSGEVVVVRDGQRLTASLHDVHEKDVVETGDDGAATLRFPDGRAVELSANGRFEVGADTSGVVLSVEKGIVLSRVPKGPPAGAPKTDVALTILTPFGLTRVGASEVQVDVQADTARVDVNVGEVELVSRGGAPMKAEAGTRGALTATAAPRLIVLEPVQVVITEAQGQTFVKKGGAAWAKVAGKALPALAPGDSVRVTSGRLTLTPKGSDTRVVLESGSELTVGETRSDGDVDELVLPLKSGAATVTTGRKSKTRVSLGGGVRLVSDLGAQVTVTKTADGFDVAPLSGKVTLVKQGQAPREVKGGQRATVGGEGITVREPELEPLTLSLREGQRVFHPGAEPISLEWEGGGGKITVASDARHAKVVAEAEVTRGFFTVTAPAAGTLFWVVKRGAVEVGRGSATFGPEPRKKDLDRQRNVVPEGPEKTTIFFQDKAPSVSFSWKATPGAASASVAVYREGDFSRPLAERKVTASTMSLPEGTLGEGRYAWSVTPLDAKGAPVRGGRMNKLELVWDNAVSSLRIASPRNGDPLAPSVTVEGVAPVGSRLFVNGQPVSLDAKARFRSKAAPLAKGLVVFRLSQGTAESLTVRRLLPGR